MKVLIAEDDFTTRHLLKLLFKKWGYETETVTEGASAWQKIQDDPALQLLILDWQMPQMTGPEIAKMVRNTSRDFPPYIILLTSRDKKSDIIEGLEAGADEYITKPFDPGELKARVQVARRVIELQNALQHRILELQDALNHVKTLQGLLPICMHCHKIRTEEEVWERLETYIEEHSDATLSHGLCPDCMKKYYSDYMKSTDDEVES